MCLHRAPVMADGGGGILKSMAKLFVGGQAPRIRSAEQGARALMDIPDVRPGAAYARQCSPKGPLSGPEIEQAYGYQEGSILADFLQQGRSCEASRSRTGLRAAPTPFVFRN
jgi:hypothetical protein